MQFVIMINEIPFTKVHKSINLLIAVH